MTTEQAAKTMEDANGAMSQAVVVWDRLDNELIEAQLNGRSVTTWAYSFQQDTKKVTGLSVEGVEECSRLSAMKGEALRLLKWTLEDQGDAFFAIVECGRYAVKADTGEAILLDTSIGTKRELKNKTRRTGGFYRDPNAADVAMSKAARNAKAKLLDPQLKEQVLNAALTSGRVAVTTRDDVRRVERAQQREAIPPPQPKIDEDEARRRFYATAKERCGSQAEIHMLAGVNCHPEAQHDIDQKDPAYCNALRDAVERHPATKAEAWEHFRTRLVAAADEAAGQEPEDIPFATADDLPATEGEGAQSSMIEEAPVPH